jgi:hypothetical protein
MHSVNACRLQVLSARVRQFGCFDEPDRKRRETSEPWAPAFRHKGGFLKREREGGGACVVRNVRCGTTAVVLMSDVLCFVSL